MLLTSESGHGLLEFLWYRGWGGLEQVIVVISILQTDKFHQVKLFTPINFSE